VNESHALVRRRSNIAHELGHYLLEHPFDHVILGEDHNRQFNDEQEKQATFIAGELLIPLAAAERMAFDGWDNARVAAAHGVSAQFAQMQMKGQRVRAQRAAESTGFGFRLRELRAEHSSRPRNSLSAADRSAGLRLVAVECGIWSSVGWVRRRKGVPQQGQRWIEVTPSQFTHEAEGLNIVRSLLPQSAPFRAWSNFEFRDGQGKWHEVDLLVLGRRRLHLVELKYYRGTLRGDDLTWRRDGHRAEDSPLKLARRKAQRLASKLQDELIRWAHETNAQVTDARSVVPFVQESVFLHHPELRCLLPMASRTDLFGLDGDDDKTGLPGISDRLLEAATPHQSVPQRRDETITKLMTRIGVVQRRQREAGSWVIDEDPLGEGDGWQDWPAFHRVATTRQARIRFLVTSPGAPATERTQKRRLAEHEFRIMSRLPNERLLRPEDMVENDLGVGLVYPVDERFQRLDLWLADQAGRVPLADQLSLLRQVAEAVSYAHQNRVVHRD